jgi:hypothetical protein
MSKQQFVKTAICSKYQTLLYECERALSIWSEQRAEICQSRLVGKEAGDELLRLQAKYARAYTVLQNHAHNCSLCQLVSRLPVGNTIAEIKQNYERQPDGEFEAHVCAKHPRSEQTGG